MLKPPGLSIHFLEKEPYSGSFSGKRYYLNKSEDMLMACAYPEPWCYEKTPEEHKIRKEFPFTPEGLADALRWLETVSPGSQSAL